MLLICFLIHFIVVAWYFYVLYFFCRLSVLCCLRCHCLLEHYYSFAIIILYLFLFLFSLLTHCVSYSSYCHRCLYDLALTLLVWLLTLLVYHFPYVDFIVN